MMAQKRADVQLTSGQASLILYTGANKTTVPSPLTAPKSSLIENKGLLPKVHPELAAGWSLVSNETVSHVITTTSEICDPQVSSLLDLGHAVDFENDDSGNRIVPIAVFASGECGNFISFRRIEEDTLELRQPTTWMRVPSIGETESAEWPTGGAPVRQICFSRTIEEKATWMAARFASSTTIFRPLYHREPVSMHVDRHSGYRSSNSTRNSRLDANALVEISSLRTGGFAHADVTFNPWYQRQFAIVDQGGNWSIWDISGRNRQNKGNWAATCVREGSLPWLDNGDNLDHDNQPRHDGWATIEWAGDVNSFIVSDRRCAILYRMENEQIWPIPIELGLKRKSEWILDIIRSSSNVSHIFVLTTTQIFWLEITSSSDFLGDGDTESSLYPRLSWRHFRDPEDTTLRLSPLLTNQGIDICFPGGALCVRWLLFVIRLLPFFVFSAQPFRVGLSMPWSNRGRHEQHDIYFRSFYSGCSFVGRGANRISDITKQCSILHTCFQRNCTFSSICWLTILQSQRETCQVISSWLTACCSWISIHWTPDWGQYRRTILWAGGFTIEETQRNTDRPKKPPPGWFYSWWLGRIYIRNGCTLDFTYWNPYSNASCNPPVDPWLHGGLCYCYGETDDCSEWKWTWKTSWGTLQGVYHGIGR